MLQFRIAEGCSKTGATLQKLCEGAHSPRVGVVCWGRGYNGTEPALNRAAGAANKLQQLEAFKKAGILVPPFWRTAPTAPEDYPLLGRSLNHHGGLDIRLIMQATDLKFHPGIDYFMRYVPRLREFRSWIYRRRHLGTYEKVQTKAATKVGANYRNGFSFQLVAADQLPAGIREISSSAVEALGLDFGAVDILQGQDNAYYVLEVNTAPGVEGENRQVIRALADKILRWQTLGFPRRNGDRVGEGLGAR